MLPCLLYAQSTTGSFGLGDFLWSVHRLESFLFFYSSDGLVGWLGDWLAAPGDMSGRKNAAKRKATSANGRSRAYCDRPTQIRQADRATHPVDLRQQGSPPPPLQQNFGFTTDHHLGQGGEERPMRKLQKVRTDDKVQVFLSYACRCLLVFVLQIHTHTPPPSFPPTSLREGLSNNNKHAFKVSRLSRETHRTKSRQRVTLKNSPVR